MALPSVDAAFYEVRAVVLSNMGQHKQALEIYVFKMQDYGKAEERVIPTPSSLIKTLIRIV